MTDQHLLEAVAKVAGCEELEALRRALDCCHYSRYNFRRSGEQLTRELADEWEYLRVSMDRIQGALGSMRSSPVRRRLFSQLWQASELAAEVVALFASCLHRGSGARPQKGMECGCNVAYKNQERVDRLFQAVCQAKRSQELVHTMRIAVRQIDQSLASASIHEGMMSVKTTLLEPRLLFRGR